jgi:hypothetical protein
LETDTEAQEAIKAMPFERRAGNPVYGPETDHRDPHQWEFYVVSASLLPDGQRTIGLSKIRKLANPVGIAELGSAVHHQNPRRNEWPLTKPEIRSLDRQARRA